MTHAAVGILEIINQGLPRVGDDGVVSLQSVNGISSVLSIGIIEHLLGTVEVNGVVAEGAVDGHVGRSIGNAVGAVGAGDDGVVGRVTDIGHNKSILS